LIKFLIFLFNCIAVKIKNTIDKRER